MEKLVDYEALHLDFEEIQNDTVKRLIRGKRYLFNRLTIPTGSVLEIISEPEDHPEINWWEDSKKWAILEVFGDFIIEGKLVVNNWKRPKMMNSLEVDEKINVLGEILSHSMIYRFGMCGSGGNGGSFFTVPVATGGIGDTEFGGGGGGGFGWTHVDHHAHCIAAPPVVGRMGGPGAPGTVALPGMPNYPMCGGKGGDGALTPDKGVGGLLIIICHGKMVLNGQILINGTGGVAGSHGDPSNPNYEVAGAWINGGHGGGGGGSAALPGGKLYLYSKNQVDFEKIITDKSVGGIGGNGGSNINVGEPGLNGIKGDDGEPAFLEIINI